MKKLFLFVCILGVAALAFSFKNGLGGKVTMTMTYEVKDYMGWKRLYDQTELTRTKTLGTKTQGIYISTENKNLITVMVEVMTEQGAKEYLESDDFSKLLKKAQFDGTPEVKIMTKVF